MGGISKRGIVYSFGGFNNPSPTGNPQDILKATFSVPLTNASGLPLGGFGTRWIVFQHGPFAGAGGGGGAAKRNGRGYATLQPPSTPLKAWAARIQSFRSLDCESEDDFSERVRDNIVERAGFVGATTRSPSWNSWAPGCVCLKA